MAGDTDFFLRPDSVQVFDYPITTDVGHQLPLGLRQRPHPPHEQDDGQCAACATTSYSSCLPEQGNPGTGPFATENLYPETRDGFPVYRNLSPRLSVAYDVLGNGRMAIKASYGRYTGASSGSIATSRALGVSRQSQRRS